MAVPTTDPGMDFDIKQRKLQEKIRRAQQEQQAQQTFMPSFDRTGLSQRLSSAFGAPAASPALVPEPEPAVAPAIAPSLAPSILPPGHNVSGAAGLRRVYTSKDAAGNNVYSDDPSFRVSQDMLEKSEETKAMFPTQTPYAGNLAPASRGLARPAAAMPMYGQPSADATERLFDANQGGEYDPMNPRPLVTRVQEEERVKAARNQLMENITPRATDGAGINPLDLAKFNLDVNNTAFDNNIAAAGAARADTAENRAAESLAAQQTRAFEKQGSDMVKMADDAEDPTGASRAVAIGLTTAPVNGTPEELANFFKDDPRGEAYEYAARKSLQRIGKNVGLRSLFFNSSDSDSITARNIGIDNDGNVIMTEAGNNLFGDDAETITLDASEKLDAFGTDDPRVIAALLEQFKAERNVDK